MTDKPDIDQLLGTMETGLAELLEQQPLTDPAFIGIRTGGVWLAQRLQKTLLPDAPLGELDISFYRDDFSRIGLNPRVEPSHLSFDTEGRDLILVDDVIMSGRTIRAAMNELFDYGRPSRIILVCLVDVGARDLPIHPDISGGVLSLEAGQRVKLRGPEPLRIEIQSAGEAGNATPS